MNSFKFAVAGSILLACGLSLAACSDDNENENDKPAIYEQIEVMYSELNGKTKCEDITRIADKYTKDNVRMSKACTEYSESLAKNASGNVDKLIHSFDNSGYYLATYLLIHRLDEQITECTAEREFSVTSTNNAWQKIFEKNGCGDMVTKANDVAKKRGK